MSGKQVRLYPQNKARKLLQVTNYVFYQLVEEGKIRSYTPEGTKTARYYAEDVDALAEKFKRERELFVMDNE